MKIIGLTGGVASGKTTIAKFFKKKGLLVHDSDKVVKNLYKNKSKEFVKHLLQIGLKKAVGPNKINKGLIREEVFKSKKKLKKLEKYVHKKVESSRNLFIKKHKKNKNIIILDIPLLFENNLQKICSCVILAYCPINIRKKRAIKRKNVNIKTFKNIIRFQMPDKTKIKKANFVIDTSKTWPQTKKKILIVLNKIKKKKPK